MVDEILQRINRQFNTVRFGHQTYRAKIDDEFDLAKLGARGFCAKVNEEFDALEKIIPFTDRNCPKGQTALQVYFYWSHPQNIRVLIEMKAYYPSSYKELDHLFNRLKVITNSLKKKNIDHHLKLTATKKEVEDLKKQLHDAEQKVEELEKEYFL